jgi:hypothetical protein
MIADASVFAGTLLRPIATETSRVFGSAAGTVARGIVSGAQAAGPVIADVAGRGIMHGAQAARALGAAGAGAAQSAVRGIVSGAQAAGPVIADAGIAIGGAIIEAGTAAARIAGDRLVQLGGILRDLGAEGTERVIRYGSLGLRLLNAAVRSGSVRLFRFSLAIIERGLLLGGQALLGLGRVGLATIEGAWGLLRDGAVAITPVITNTGLQIAIGGGRVLASGGRLIGTLITGTATGIVLPTLRYIVGTPGRIYSALTATAAPGAGAGNAQAVLRIRQRNSPLYYLLEAAGQLHELPYGHRIGEYYRPGYMGGRRNKTRKTRRRA